MPAFDSLQRASFGNVAFPVESVHVRASLRRHQHEYPPAAGAATEKMGRTPYTIEMVGNFQNTFEKYPTLWPLGLNVLRGHFEDEATKDLHIPTIGTIKAYILDWDQSMEAKIRSGEKCTLRFEEDFENAFLKSALGQISSSNMAYKAAQFDATARQFPPVPSIFDDITNAVNGVLAIKDQAELTSSLLESKIAYAIGLIKTADQTVEQLQSADNWRLMDSVMELWASLTDLATNLKNTVAQPSVWTTPNTMTTFDIAVALYDGDGSRGGDILSLNSFEDPFAVQAGTRVKYYPDLAA